MAKKHASKASGMVDEMQGVAKESELHAAIVKECADRRWVALHGSMAHSTHRTLGEWDFVVLADRGRKFLIECKSKTGKLSPEQVALHHMADGLGHSTHVIRSMAEFRMIVDAETPSIDQEMVKSSDDD